jgi:hypothetical protein
MKIVSHYRRTQRDECMISAVFEPKRRFQSILTPGDKVQVRGNLVEEHIVV